jgi:UDP-glucose 4-epimerase
MGKVELIQGDMALKETWDKLPSDIEYIFHFAAPSSITLFNRTPEKCYGETVFGMYYALEYAKKNKIKKLIYPSSGSNYAGNPMPHKEDIYIKPRNLYAAGKVACEGLANSYSDYVKSIGLRIFASFGPGEEWKGEFASAVYLFIRDVMNDKSPVIFGDGKQTRDFIYIEDVADGIIVAAETDYIGIVNIGTGRQTSFN